MSDKARIRIAATVTALFLAGISAAGLAAHSGHPQPATATTTPSAATPARASAPDLLATGDDRFEAVEDDE